MIIDCEIEKGEEIYAIINQVSKQLEFLDDVGMRNKCK